MEKKLIININNSYKKEDKNNNNNEFKKSNGIKAIVSKNFDYEEIEKKGWFSKYYESKIKTGDIFYMNSSIQCLFHLKDFTDNITKTYIKCKKPLIKAIFDLINDMKNCNAINEKYKKNSQDTLSVEKIKK